MDEQERLKQRKKRRRAIRRKHFFKNLLIFLGILVIAIAAFLVTMKICDPDFKVSSLIPHEKVEQVAAFVKEDVLGKTTTQPTTVTTTAPTTTKPTNYDYVAFDEFGFDTALQGNQIGNLLNKSQGRITYSSSYIYYSVKGKGLYRFEPESEVSTALVVKNYNFVCLNVLGDYIYMIDKSDNKLKRAAVSGGDTWSIADDISFAYLYNDKIYYVGTDNSVGFIDTSEFNKTQLYSAGSDKEVNFVGISLSRVFFSLKDKVTDSYEYITVDVNNKNDRQYFMDDTKSDEIKSLELEGGYFYFYQKKSDNKYSLMRKKFGSENVVKLIENCNITDYPSVYRNRLYYTYNTGDYIQAREVNMNSKENKLMVYYKNTNNIDDIGIGYGYQYVYLIGADNAIYKGSCIYTSASRDNTLTISNGKWQY